MECQWTSLTTYFWRSWSKIPTDQVSASYFKWFKSYSHFKKVSGVSGVSVDVTDNSLLALLAQATHWPSFSILYQMVQKLQPILKSQWGQWSVSGCQWQLTFCALGPRNPLTKFQHPISNGSKVTANYKKSVGSVECQWTSLTTHFWRSWSKIPTDQVSAFYFKWFKRYSQL